LPINENKNLSICILIFFHNFHLGKFVNANKKNHYRMIGNLYRNQGSGHSSKNNSFKSSILYTGMHDESCRTLDLNMNQSFEFMEDSDCDSSGSSFGGDCTGVDASQISFVVGDDENLDELEKALEAYAAKEERQAAKEAAKEKQKEEKKEARRRSMGTTLPQESDHTRRSAGVNTNTNTNTSTNRLPRCNTMPERPTLQRKDSSRSIGSNKSLTLGAIMGDSSNRKLGRRGASAGVQKTFSSSNRSLLSLCPPKDQLLNIFGPPADAFQTFDWDSYFQEINPQDVGTITSELERAITSKKLKRLERLHQKGVSMNARNKQGETVAHLVCRQGSPEMLIYLIQKANVSVRVRDHSHKTPLHEIAWSPTFNPSIAMMLMSDSPELLWAPDARGFLALDYVPKRTMTDWYEFLEIKQPMLKLALQFSRFKATSAELNHNQERLRKILERQLQDKDRSA
jgi:Ankyrin repeats (many copies)